MKYLAELAGVSTEMVSRNVKALRSVLVATSSSPGAKE